MDAKLFRRFDDIPWPERSELKFVSEIREIFTPGGSAGQKNIFRYSGTAAPGCRSIFAAAFYY